MDDMITRIVEIEKQCADEIEKAEQACREKIETHRRAAQERKAGECARIVSEDEAQLAQAIEAAKKKTEEESLKGCIRTRRWIVRYRRR